MRLSHTHRRTEGFTDPDDQMVTMDITAEIYNLGELSLVLDQIERVHNVLNAHRGGLNLVKPKSLPNPRMLLEFPVDVFQSPIAPPIFDA